MLTYSWQQHTDIYTSPIHACLHVLTRQDRGLSPLSHLLSLIWGSIPNSFVDADSTLQQPTFTAHKLGIAFIGRRLI